MLNKDTTNGFIHLCSIEEISDPGSKEFSWEGMSWPMSFFVVRSGYSVYGYLNSCPHAGHPLNLQKDDFLTNDYSLIQCQSHGARFKISNGLCVFGPCVGAVLQSIPLGEVNGKISVEISDLKKAFNALI
ncbi:MAG: hypothetical protein CBC38_03150 [Gammaproteobacteria bacterium TMED78]|nr:MAG: hypothetical protein CBC38_03150 [Gammaproteobacteria bacterium TMED78]|tara:strand:- start:2620 stop:3009 length:390 start_codon:yes stop_codon:yes gene_type:complete